MTDGAGNEATCTATVAVNPLNRPPMVLQITAPLDPSPVNSTISCSATFSDPDEGDTHTAVWEWGDGSTWSITLPVGDRSVSGSHEYTAAGVHTLKLTVTDAAGESDWVLVLESSIAR